MASPNLYVRSTDGSDSDNGTTWALAKATLAGVAAIDSTTDNVLWVSQAHAESSASSQSIAIAGTNATPSKILCGNDGAEPPTALATTATVATTTTNPITFSGSFYCYGIAFTAGSGASSGANLIFNNVSGGYEVFEKCSFTLGSSAAGQGLFVSTSSPTAPTKLRWKNCDLKFSGADQDINVCAGFEWSGGTILAGSSTSTTGLLRFDQARVAEVLIENVDFSVFSTSLCLASSSFGGSHAKAVFRNCKMPSSFTLWSSAPTHAGVSIQLYNCDSGDTNYRLWTEDFGGSVKSETTIVKSSGASDGTTALSWVMVSSSTAEYPLIVLQSPEIVQWNETTGSAVTCTVEIVHDTNVAGGQGAGTSYAYQDDEVWLEVTYLGTSGTPLGLFISDGKGSSGGTTATDILATAVDQTSSSVTWTTTGLTTPVKQKLSVTFTPQEKGFVHAVVCVAKASKTVYVDPLLTIA